MSFSLAETTDDFFLADELLQQQIFDGAAVLDERRSRLGSRGGAPAEVRIGGGIGGGSAALGPAPVSASSSAASSSSPPAAAAASPLALIGTMSWVSRVSSPISKGIGR